MDVMSGMIGSAGDVTVNEEPLAAGNSFIHREMTCASRCVAAGQCWLC